MSEFPVSSRELRRRMSRPNHQNQEDSEWVTLGHEESDSVIFDSRGSSSPCRHFGHEAQNQPPLRRVHGHRKLNALVPRLPTPIPRDVFPLRPRAGTDPLREPPTAPQGSRSSGP
ncbi:hypothetical protein FPQ18DRAFT_310011 [Pyronema domesticum]|nr:hypothetical protein FPQ18DRAFT_310011 [Pyronema domesticum]